MVGNYRGESVDLFSRAEGVSRPATIRQEMERDGKLAISQDLILLMVKLEIKTYFESHQTRSDCGGRWGQ